MKFDGSKLCYYCGGTGWQAIAVRSESGAENEERAGKYKDRDSPCDVIRVGHTIAVRPCACTAAPQGRRSAEPLKEPEFRRRPQTDVWEPNPTMPFNRD